MKIIPINFSPLNINNNPNFEAKYTKLKQIKDLPCACCGKPVLDATKIYNAYKSLTKPLSECLQKINFKWFEYNIPKAMELLRQFATEQPKDNIDVILEDNEKLKLLTKAIKEHYLTPETIKEVKDDDYKKRRLDCRINDELKNIQNRSRGVFKSASIVVKRFASMKKYLRDRDLEVFKQLQIYAEKYPKLRLSEIIQLEEVYKFHKAKDILQRGETNESLNYHIGNIEKLVLKSNPNAEDKLYELKTKVREIISNESDIDARRPLIKEAYELGLQELGCEKLKNKVFAEINELPISFLTKDSKFVRFKEHEYSDIAILDSLFGPIQASEDHSKALVHEYEDNIYNVTIMHRHCNANKGSRNYLEHFKYHPMSLYYTQQQFDRISKEILEGNLPEEYNYYPTRAADNLRKCSKGKFNINVDDYCKKQIKRTQDIRQQIIEERTELRSKIGNTEEKIRFLQEKNKALECRNTELNQKSRANKAFYKELIEYQEKSSLS